MSRIITVTEAARSFDDIIDRVYYRNEKFDIQMGNQIVAHISPSKNQTTLKTFELNDFFAKIPKLSIDDLDDFEKNIKQIRTSAGRLKDKLN